MMNQDVPPEMPPVPPPPPAPPEPMLTPEQPKRNTNTWLIVGMGVVVLCCCCRVALGLAWQYGDQIMRALGQY